MITLIVFCILMLIASRIGAITVEDFDLQVWLLMASVALAESLHHDMVKSEIKLIKDRIDLLGKRK